MSEQRFTITDKEWICYNGGYAYTVSNGKCEFALWEDEDDAQRVCDYLNEQQYDTDTHQKAHKKCKEWNKKYRKDISKLADKVDEQQAIIQQLKEENEQLQKWNEYYKRELIKPIDLNKLKYKHLVGNPVVRFTEEQKKELISKFEKLEKGDG